MNSSIQWSRFRTLSALALLSCAGIAWTARFLSAQNASTTPQNLQPSFDQHVKPFLQQNCVKCHNADTMTAGVRVDHLDAGLDEKHIRLWEAIRHRVGDGTMPPKGLPQPGSAERQQVTEWITRGLDIARSRPSPKNGMVRRLTVSQYRNTLRELLMLDDDLTDGLPPDAISKDGFVNNKETLQLSPLLMEAYFDIAEEALSRAIVDPKSKPSIQNFRVDLGASVNPNPFPERLILGAGSALLDNKDVMVTQLTPTKPFAFDPFFMRTKYRFIEGYQGNDTVRGWREYDSIYHAVFADMRGAGGYPKGRAYSTAPQGLLLRPAISTDELFGIDSTYGPQANFKISVRELPDHGRFRVTVMAAKYNDGLLLDFGSPAAAGGASAISLDKPSGDLTLTVPKAGIYQVDAFPAPRNETPEPPDSSHLTEKLSASWTFDGETKGRLEGNARVAESPFGKALSLRGNDDSLTIPRDASLNVGTGDFTFSAWINPRQLRRAGIFSLGGHEWTHGWNIDMPDNKGILRIETAGPDNMSNGSVSSQPAALRANTWQHVAVVVKRGRNATRIYLNGYQVGRGDINGANLDNPKAALHIGRLPGLPAFRGEIDEVRLYSRALTEAEIQALVDPGRKFAQPPAERPQDLTLTLGDRQFIGTVQQPAFLAVRLNAGTLPARVHYAGGRGLDRLVLTPLAENSDIVQRFLTFEKRSPRLGVYLGFRRDCGSTLAPVGSSKAVVSETPAPFVFEGTIRNYPNPNVEKDNVNYLAGIREIGVRSEYTDGRDIPRLAIRSVEFEGPFYDSWPPPQHRNIFIDSPRKGETPAYAREVLRSFAARAYRRPITAAEESSIMAVFQKSSAAGRGFQNSMKDALQVILTSPQFLFLVEKSSTPQPEPIESYELASKLSYFLWNGPPDATTLKLAGSGALRKQLDSEVDRMVADPRFDRFISEFASQWLSLDKFTVLEPDRKRFPKLNRDTRVNLRQEPVQFVQHLFRNNLPARNLIASDFIVANEVVANYYDLADKTESGFQFIPIAHGRRELGGVLTQAAIMAGLSDGRESNPVKRGAWLARKIVAEPPDDPPPNVPALKEDNSMKLTLRQRIEQHRNQQGCRQCHSKIDPWGIAFEEFDAGGRLKPEPADARSTLPDRTEVSGIHDLRKYLSEDRIDQVAFSVLKHLATYANGRNLTYKEHGDLKQEGLKLRAGGYRMKDMIKFVVNSRIFLEK